VKAEEQDVENVDVYLMLIEAKCSEYRSNFAPPPLGAPRGGERESKEFQKGKLQYKSTDTNFQ